MTTFKNWLVADTDYLFRLREVSTEFPKTKINDLYNRQIDQLRHKVSPEARRDLERARGFNLVGYVAQSLRNAGFQHHDIDPLAQDVVIRLLIQPGNLIRGWNGQPFMPRVKVAIRNAVLNLVEKRQRRRRWFRSVAPDQVDVAMQTVPGEDDQTIERFRQEVQKQLGDLALAVLDARLDGLDTKALVGTPELFSPTSYQIKKAVKQIKALAQQFGDEEFRAMVARAMDAEQQTFAKRFGAKVTA